MRVLAITLAKEGGYGAVIRTTVTRALTRAGVDHDVITLSDDLSAYPGYDIYLGVGDEMFWRKPDMVATIRAMGGISVDLRSRYMARRLNNIGRWFTDHRGRGPDWVFTHLRSSHSRAHYIGQCVDETELYPEHGEQFTVFIDHYMPKRQSALTDILRQCEAIHAERPDTRFWYMSASGIVENAFTETCGLYKTYPFSEIARYYRQSHVVLPTHRETQGMLAAEIGMCGGLTLLQPWMYPAERRAEVPHQLYTQKIELPETVDIAGNRAWAQKHFSIESFATRIKAGLIKAMETPRIR